MGNWSLSVVLAAAMLFVLPAALAKHAKDDCRRRRAPAIGLRSSRSTAPTGSIRQPDNSNDCPDQQGEDRVPVLLDNTFGTDTLVIGATHLARHGSSGLSLGRPTMFLSSDNVLIF